MLELKLHIRISLITCQFMFVSYKNITTGVFSRVGIAEYFSAMCAGDHCVTFCPFSFSAIFLIFDIRLLIASLVYSNFHFYSEPWGQSSKDKVIASTV